MLLALMDCNNFYASCEKAFQPRLAGVPVVVLSNNDGCVIARSREAKELGIPMGEPAFKCREMFKRLGVAVFSSNYALYGDMSARVMATAGALVPRMEVYSIDEAFLDLAGVPGGPEQAARAVRYAVWRATGIPVSIGIGPTKTLAKAANKLAKKDAPLGGVLALPSTSGEREAFLRRVEIGDVWGIGHRHARRLRERGVLTALDFTRLDRNHVKKKMTVGGLHTWLELRGTPCIHLERAPKPKQSIVNSRSFGSPVTALRDMLEAVSHHASRAAEKLRGQNGQAATVHVWVQTYTFVEGDPQYTGTASLPLCPPTAHTARIVARAREVLESIFRQGYRYKKAGVMLSGIEARGTAQLSLLEEPDPRRDRLMDTLDKVNARWGRGTLFPASSGIKRPWSMKQEMRSPRYTTVWTELPVAFA